jgi:23S rRNA pseudouridine1911/1915/1917 synthase
MGKYQAINSEAGVGLRLDIFLLKEISQNYPQYNITRSFISNNVEQFVLVNGEHKKKGYTLKGSDRVEVDFEALEELVTKDNNTEIIAQEGKLDVVYEDTHVLVINKPQGLVVHLGDGNKDNTLVNYLKYYFEAQGIDCSSLERCGLVHRLDKGVSGLMIIAKDRETQLALKAQFESHDVIKVYKAKVVGDISSVDPSKLPGLVVAAETVKDALDSFIAKNFIIDESWSGVEGYIKRDKANRKRMRFSLEKDDSTGKRALSYMKFFKNNEVLIKIETGRMHQIRATLKFLGLTIEGDTLYSAGGKNSDAISLQSVLLGAKINTDDFKFWGLI